MGTVVISLDAELAWGYHDLDPYPVEKTRGARYAWSWLVDAFEAFDLPATWAVVGHLFLDRCDGDHADHPTPPGWFRRDPGGSAVDHPLWFGPDLIRAVLDSPVGHEIGSHSFSHVPFAPAAGDPLVSRAALSAELSRCVDLAARWGLSLESLVFPRNRVGHLDLLADHGLRNYRAPATPRIPSRTAGRVGKLVDYGLGISTPPVSTAELDSRGLVRHEASQYLFALEDPVRTVLKPLNGAPVLRRVRAGIQRAAASGGVFHLWFHPNELRSGGDFLRVWSALELVSRAREAGDVSVETMAELGNRVRRGPRQSAPGASG